MLILHYYFFLFSVFTAGERQLALMKESGDFQSAFSRLFFEARITWLFRISWISESLCSSAEIQLQTSCKPGQVEGQKSEIWYRSNVGIEIVARFLMVPSRLQNLSLSFMFEQLTSCLYLRSAGRKLGRPGNDGCKTTLQISSFGWSSSCFPY